MGLCYCLLFAGCFETLHLGLPPKPVRPGSPSSHGGILVPLDPPTLEPPLPPPDRLPDFPPTEVKQAEVPLELAEVLESVGRHFPLLQAADQERVIAAGNRLAAEGAFDLTLRNRYFQQGGTFVNNRFDFGFEQPTAVHGINFLTGYRLSNGEFPVYYGDRDTANGGEFRGGLSIPLLKDGPIDRRRAILRQAQIGEEIADPVVRRAFLDAYRGGAKAYWNWVAAGEQFQVADALLRIARDRQSGLEQQFKAGQISEFIVVDNRRLIVEREGALIGAERRFQQTTFDLSLFVRDQGGHPVQVSAHRLPPRFSQQSPPAPPQNLAADIELAWQSRPELQRFQALRERLEVDVRLAENQTLPALNVGAFANQDVGPGKKTTGSFALDRTIYEGNVTLEVPLQRREARGRLQAARGGMAQLLAQERYVRDVIQTEVQDAHSNLDRIFQRLIRAREELRITEKVGELEMERFRKGQSTLLEVNLRELASAGARAKVIDALADYFRAQADYIAALGRIE